MIKICLNHIGVIILAGLAFSASDLAQMRQGIMDPQGQQMTETARASAIGGLVLSLIFAAGYGAMVLARL